MTKLRMTMIMAMAAWLPLQAMAADAPAAAAPQGPGMPGFDHYWAKIDPDNKGFVTKDQWMENADKRFKMIDTNNDGKISKEEMRAHDEKMRDHFKERRDHYRQMEQQQQSKPAETK